MIAVELNSHQANNNMRRSASHDKDNILGGVMAKPWHLLCFVVFAVMLASCGPQTRSRPVVSVPVVTPTPEPKPETGSESVIVLNAESEAALAKAAKQKS